MVDSRRRRVGRILKYIAVFKGVCVYMYLVEEKDQLILKIPSQVS